MFNRFPGDFQQGTLLRIHDFRFAGSHAKQPRVKLISVVNDAPCLIYPSVDLGGIES